MMVFLIQLIIGFQIIVLEDTQEYISYAPKKDIEAQDRRPFDLLVSTLCHIVLHSLPINHFKLSHWSCVFPRLSLNPGYYQSQA